MAWASRWSAGVSPARPGGSTAYPPAAAAGAGQLMRSPRTRAWRRAARASTRHLIGPGPQAWQRRMARAAWVVRRTMTWQRAGGPHEAAVRLHGPGSRGAAAVTATEPKRQMRHKTAALEGAIAEDHAPRATGTRSRIGARRGKKIMTKAIEAAPHKGLLHGAGALGRWYEQCNHDQARRSCALRQNGRRLVEPQAGSSAMLHRLGPVCGLASCARQLMRILALICAAQGR